MGILRKLVLEEWFLQQKEKKKKSENHRTEQSPSPF